MFDRILSQKVQQLYTQYPIVAILGPRQSGKTTLGKKAFSYLPYENLEDLSIRQFATEDPKQFLAQYPKGVFLDEIQYVPSLFSYLQVLVDEKDIPGQYVITGSQQFLLNEKITQSLAGRVAITTLLPLSYGEIERNSIGKSYIYDYLLNGGYPRVWRYQLNPTEFYANYVQTYVEKDVRTILNVVNLSLFQKFMQLCAGRAGQLLNVSSLANDCGITVVTARQWLSLLEASFVLYLLKPYHSHVNKRVIKSPKLYFYDTGVLCYLLGIQNTKDLQLHYAAGSIFENFILMESMKHKTNVGRLASMFFLRDQHGHEVDIVFDKQPFPLPLEVKLGQTIQSEFYKNIQYWQDLNQFEKGIVVYGGAIRQKRERVDIVGWQEYCLNIDQVLE